MLLIVAEDWIPIPRIHRLGYRFASLLVASYKQFPKKNYKKPKLPHPLFIKTKPTKILQSIQRLSSRFHLMTSTQSRSNSNLKWGKASFILVQHRNVWCQSAPHTEISFCLSSKFVSFQVNLDVSCFGSPYRYMEMQTKNAPEANVIAAQEGKKAKWHFHY